MRRRPQDSNTQAIHVKSRAAAQTGEIGLVLSGGGARAAYQIGALQALTPYLEQENNQINVIIGSSIGAINGVAFAACLKEGVAHGVSELDSIWRERTFRNTFEGSPSGAFLRAIKVAFVQYMSPGPKPTQDSVFNPAPLMRRVDEVIVRHGGLRPDDRAPGLHAVAVMTTIEGKERKPLVFASSHKPVPPDTLRGASFDICYVESLSAKHGFASAALPSILPPVEIDTDQGRVRLVDGGISQNVPVDPAVRFGANRIILVDVSGRDWWLDRYKAPHDQRPEWEVEAGLETFCIRPPDTFVVRCKQPLGPILKHAVASSTRKFIAAVGPMWPVFTLLKQKLGEDVAYETMSYVALDPDYIAGIIEQGFNETTARLSNRASIEFKRDAEVDKLVHAV